MPDMLPMHADFAGNVDSWEPKTIRSAIGFPVAFELFMATCFAFCHWMILRSKRPSNPKSPATSAVAYGLFARAQSVFLLATGILLSCDHCRLHCGCGLPPMMRQKVSAGKRARFSKQPFRDSVESRNGKRAKGPGSC